MTPDEALVLIQSALGEAVPARASEFAALTGATTLKSLRLDSLSTMEMLSILEDRLGRVLDEAELVKVKQLGDLMKLVQGAPLT